MRVLVRSMNRSLAALIALVLGISLTLIACNGDNETDNDDDTRPDPETTQPPDDEALTVPEIARQVEPSIVAVITDFGQGSGVVWSAEGVIVTNNHVVDGAQQIEVAFADGARYDAEVIAGDERTDLALLQVDRRPLPTITFIDELPDVGEFALAIGNPLGFENTVTAGIVSGVDRNLPAAAAETQQPLIGLLQTDAAISPGNSGGALVNDRGEVIGINVAFIPPQVGAVALGFAIPSATVIDVAEQLLEDGVVQHAFFGIQLLPLTPQIAEALGVEVDAGIVVIGLVDGGPADDAGVQQGDLIVSLDGDEIRTAGEFLAVIRAADPGDEVNVDLIRAGQEQQITVTLGELPDS